MNSRTFAKLVLLLTLGMLGLVSLVPQQTAAAPDVWSPKWNQAVVDASGDMGYHSSIAYQTISPGTGNTYVSYYAAGQGLKLARYKDGTGVSCSNGWDCAVIDNNGSAKLGYENALVVDSSNGFRWIAYTDPDYGRLMLMRVDNNEAKSRWIPVDIQGPLDSGIDVVKYPSIVLIDHQPRMAHYDYFKSNQATYLEVISGTSQVGYSTVAFIDSNDQPSPFGYFPSIDYDQFNDYPMVAYRGDGSSNYPASHTLNYAGTVPPGTGGNGCKDDLGGLVRDWVCRVIDPTPETGNYISFHAGGGLLDWPQVAYYNATKHTLKYAVYSGVQASCGTGAVVGWECEEIETIGTGSGVDMVNDIYPGTPTIAYYDNDDYANGVLKVARRVGSGGNCGLGSAAGKWQCVYADRGLNPFVGVHDVGRNPSITLSQDGRVYISYYDVTAKSLKVVNEKGDAPTLSKKYNQSTVNSGETVFATYVITNNLDTLLTGIYFTDYVTPTAVVLGSGPVADSCSGSFGTLNNNGVFYWSGGILGAGQKCSFTMGLVAKAPGTHVDTTALLYSTEAQFAPGVTATLIVKAFYRLFLPVVRR